MSSILSSHIRKSLEARIPASDFVKWFSPVELDCFEEASGVLSVCFLTENQYKSNWIEQKFGALIQAEIQKLCSSRALTPSIQYTYQTKNKTPTTHKQKESLAVGLGKSSQDGVDYTSRVSNKHTLENFVVGESNEIAHTVASSLLSSSADEMHARDEHLFMFYGESGYGKTHLLHAITNALSQKTKSVIYVGAETFYRAMFHNLQKKTMERFKDRYRHVEVLLIDDIHFFNRKPKIQEEFFHLLEDRLRNGKTVILTSTRAPAQMTYFEKALLGRLEQSLAVKLHKPDETACMEIVQQKCKDMNIALPPLDIIESIAGYTNGNVRGLEGILKLMRVYMENRSQPVDQHLLRKILSNLQQTQTREPSIEEICKVTAEYYGIPQAALKRGERSKTINLARQMAMFLCREMTAMSTTEIGAQFSRKHTAVVHAGKCIKKGFETENRVKCDYREIKNRINRLVNIEGR